MARRKVTRTKKDRDGDILALCNPAEYWSPRQKANAIRDIESGVNSYYTESGGKIAQVYVKDGPRGKVVQKRLPGLPRTRALPR